MPTRFTSLGVAGAVTIGGLLTAVTVVLTTLTATTGNFTTVNTQTASGSIVRVRNQINDSGSLVVGANATFEGGIRNTASGDVMKSGGGINVGNAAGLLTKRNLSGGSFNLNGFSSGNILCVKTTGAVGKCTGSLGTTGLCGNCQ